MWRLEFSVPGSGFSEVPPFGGFVPTSMGLCSSPLGFLVEFAVCIVVRALLLVFVLFFSCGVRWVGEICLVPKCWGGFLVGCCSGLVLVVIQG